MCAKTLAVFESFHSRLVKLTRWRHVVYHFAKCVNRFARASLHQFPREFRGPLKNMAWPLGSRRRQSNHMTQATFPLSRVAPKGCIRPADQSHGATARLLPDCSQGVLFQLAEAKRAFYPTLAIGFFSHRSSQSVPDTGLSPKGASPID